MTSRKRGPAGSVMGIPEPEVTALLVDIVSELAEDGLDFERSQAQALLNDRGLEGETLNGFLFGLQRTIPGLENTGYGTYRLPRDWEVATRNRMWRFRLGGLDVLDALALRDLLTKAKKLTPGLEEALRKLESELGALDA